MSCGNAASGLHYIGMICSGQADGGQDEHSALNVDNFAVDVASL